MKLAAAAIIPCLLAPCGGVAQSKLGQILDDLDCQKHELKQSQRQLVLKGEASIWVFLNMGPSELVVLTRSDRNFRRIVGLWDGKSMPVFVGDTRFKYTINLPENASETTLHVCTVPSR